MMSSITLPSSSSSSLIFESVDLPRSRSSSAPPSRVSCCSRSHANIPKLEPFNRRKIDRYLKDPPLIEKSENDLANYCTKLEGDDAYRCWRSYFELKDLEKDLPKDDVEKIIRQSGGVKSLIDIVHGISTLFQRKDNQKSDLRTSNSNETTEDLHKPFPVPDGLPKSQEEIEEEEKGKMPDSSFTRLLRAKGRFPAWFTPAPDHETD